MTTLRALAAGIILSWGWKRALLALIAGALSALAMAPFNAWPILFLTIPVAVWLIDGSGAGRLGGIPAAALSGWWFGFGYFVAGLYWVGYAFLVDANTFAWLLPFAVMGLPALLALFMAFGFALARLIWTADASRILARRRAHGQRMAARTYPHRLSMEHARLRADRTAGACANRFADRPVGPDVHRGLRIRKSRRLDRRSPDHATAVARACILPSRSRRDGRLRSNPAGE